MKVERFFCFWPPIHFLYLDLNKWMNTSIYTKYLNNKPAKQSHFTLKENQELLSPIGKIVARGDTQLLLYFMSTGIDPNIQDQSKLGDRLAHIALRYTQFDTFLAILDKRIDLSMTNNLGYSILHLMALTVTAAKDILTIFSKIKTNDSFEKALNQSNNENMTALHLATAKKNYIFVEVLLENNADINLRNKEDLKCYELTIDDRLDDIYKNQFNSKDKINNDDNDNDNKCDNE